MTAPAPVAAVPAVPAGVAAELPLLVVPLGTTLRRTRPVAVAELPADVSGDALDAVLAALTPASGTPLIGAVRSPATAAVGTLRHSTAGVGRVLAPEALCAAAVRPVVCVASAVSWVMGPRAAVGVAVALWLVVSV